MSRIDRLPVPVAALAVAALALASCGGGGDGDVADASSTTGVLAGGSGDGSSASTMPADTAAESTAATTTTATTAPAPPTTAAPATTEPPSDDGACLVGDWVVTEDQMNVFYSGLMSTLDAPLEITAAGSADLWFDADGTYGWLPDFALLVELMGVGGVGEATGSIIGSWTAADGVITTSSEVNALDVAITVAGRTSSGSDMANGLLNSSPVNGVTYDCNGATPVLDFVTSDPGLTIPITLAPA